MSPAPKVSATQKACASAKCESLEELILFLLRHAGPHSPCELATSCGTTTNMMQRELKRLEKTGKLASAPHGSVRKWYIAKS